MHGTALAVAVLVLLSGGSAYSPTHTIDGLVTDQDGLPLADALVCPADDYRRSVATDQRGRFRIHTRPQSLIVRKAGYRSRLLSADADLSAPIVLQSAPADRPKRCSTGQYCLNFDGVSGRFCLPLASGIEAGPQSVDVDHASRAYVLNPASRKAVLRHGVGHAWSWGLPFERDVLQSSWFDEVVYSAGRFQILDARGRSSDGARWRFLGMIGESAFYHGADEESARRFDRMLDGMCLLREE